MEQQSMEPRGCSSREIVRPSTTMHYSSEEVTRKVLVGRSLEGKLMAGRRNKPSTSRVALLWRVILWVLCTNASLVSHGYAYDDGMICTTTEFAETSSISLLHEDPPVLNMTVYETSCENLLRANYFRRLNQRSSKGFLPCVCNCLKQARGEGQDRVEGRLFVCRNKHKQNVLKVAALYYAEGKRTLRRSRGIGASGKEGAKLRHARHVELDDEGSISLQDGQPKVPCFCVHCRKFLPVARDDLVEPSRNGAVISDPSKNDYHDAETPSLEVTQVVKTSEYLLICTALKGLSRYDNASYWKRDPMNQIKAVKVTEPVDHVHRNIQFEDVSSLHPRRKSLTKRRSLFEATAVIAPVEAPAPSIVTPVPAPSMSPVEAPFASPPSPAPVVTPVGAPFMSPASAPAPAIEPPSPPYPPYPPYPPSPPSPPPPPPSPPPPPPSPPPPPIVPLDFGLPGETSLLKPTINAPTSYSIKNVSVFLTGVMVPFLSITPSSILLLKVASMKRGPMKLPTLHHRKQYPRVRRRLFPIMPSRRRLFQAPAPAPDWEPQTPGVSEALQIFLQVDAGSLLVPLPGYLMYYTQHQPTASDEWIPLMQSTDPWVWVPGAGIQFMATVNEMNDALLNLEFGLGLGNGQSKTCNFVVIVSHQFDNLTTIPELTTRKDIELKVAGAGAWFVAFQYTKTFFQNSLGVVCFFALTLLFLCCILGCCVCHDFKMERVFQKNRTVLKAQNVLFNETRLFNPVWIPSAPVGPGRKRFIVVHNDKFLQQRLADHLSSLHDGAMAEKMSSTVTFKRHFRGESYIHDVSDTDGMSLSLASGSSPDYSEDDGGSPSQQSTKKEIRKPGSPSTRTD